MPLTSQAQLIEILELPEASHEMEHWEPEMEALHPDVVLEMQSDEPSADVIEHPENMELEVEELPGVKGLDPDLEAALEVFEDPKDKGKDKDTDENDARKTQKITKWDWESKGPQGFIAWLQERLHDVPKHSGYDHAGLERAIAYMEKLDNEISRAMRLDLDGELDADKIEEVRAKIDDGIERLHARLDKIKKKHGKRRKKSNEQADLIKQAQKIPAISGIVISVPLYVSAIVRTCINGMVSTGRDIEESFATLAKKYKLNDREKMECIVHFQDMGLTVRRDRSLFPDEDFDPTSHDGIDLETQYPH